MAWFSRDAHPERQLSAYVDGELDARARSVVQAHLAACEACSALAEELQQAKSLLAALPRQAPGRSFALGPEYAVQRRAEARRSSFTFAPVAALTVLVALLFVDAVNFSSMSSSSDTAGGASTSGAPAAARQAESADKDAAGSTADRQLPVDLRRTRASLESSPNQATGTAPTAPGPNAYASSAGPGSRHPGACRGPRSNTIAS